MNKFIIRRMMSIDIDSVHAVEVESFTTPWSKGAFISEAENELTHYLVAVDTDTKQIIGYAGMWIIVDEAHVTNIAVLPKYRGQGLGNMLVMALKDAAKARGAGSMTLEVRRTNATAQGLYTKMGFAVRGMRPKYYTDNGEDALIMWCDSL